LNGAFYHSHPESANAKSTGVIPLVQNEGEGRAKFSKGVAKRT